MAQRALHDPGGAGGIWTGPALAGEPVGACWPDPQPADFTPARHREAGLAIRSGVVGQMRSELTASPQAREMSTVGEPTVTPAMISELRASPGVAFAAPRTRLLSAAAVMRTRDLQKGIDLDLVSSGQGDPVVRGRWQRNSVAISENAARQLGIKAGAPVVMVIERRNSAGERISPCH